MEQELFLSMQTVKISNDEKKLILLCSSREYLMIKVLKMLCFLWKYIPKISEFWPPFKKIQQESNDCSRYKVFSNT